MEPARWERLQEIYHQALAVAPSELDVYLKGACAGDLDLFREVESLLKAAHSRGGILDCPVVELGSASSILGTTIGERYRIESELPHGGMSQVYLATDLRLSQQVVVKVLSPTLIENSYAQSKFDQEVEALLRMEHPGVVRVQDRGELPDRRPYIVMPYIDGVSLRSQIPSEGMDLERVAAIVKQIGEALDHVHEHEILHRDLKPENIMLRRGTDSVVLIDFGVAKIASSTVSMIAGTAPYMSPEQLRGHQLTRTTDIYSMGVVAYEMVTGRRPFKPPSPSQLLETQRGGVRVRPKQLREDLSDKADRAIIRALKFEPRARYRTAGEFGDQLSNALSEKVVVHNGITWATLIVGLIFIVAVAYGIYWYSQRSHTAIVQPAPTPTLTPTPSRPLPNHALTYFLTVQRMRNGKVYQPPYNSNGSKDTFDRGDQFQLNIFATEPGFLYVFNEGPPETRDTSFTMVYPNKKINNASATLGANQTAQTDWMTFSGAPGDENVWIVWSTRVIPELEDAKTEALNHQRGGLTGDHLVSVKAFLQTKKSEAHVTVRHYKAGPKTEVKGDGEMLITLAQFNHH